MIARSAVSINNIICTNKNTIVSLGNEISVDPVLIAKNRLTLNTLDFQSDNTESSRHHGNNYFTRTKFNSAILIQSPDIHSILFPLNLDISKLSAAI
jgi:hypothetical protein